MSSMRDTYKQKPEPISLINWIKLAAFISVFIVGGFFEGSGIA